MPNISQINPMLVHALIIIDTLVHAIIRHGLVQTKESRTQGKQIGLVRKNNNNQNTPK